jgi:hypothetical protein
MKDASKSIKTKNKVPYLQEAPRNVQGGAYISTKVVKRSYRG